MHNYVDVTDDVYISGIYPSDDHRYVHLFRDEEISKTLLAVPFPYTLADAHWWIDYVAKQCQERGARWNFSIRSKSTDNEVIGGIGLHEIDSESGEGEIGYWIAPAYWGRGLMPQILSKWIDYIESSIKSGSSAFAGLITLRADIFSHNLASGRVLEKCGFEFVRTITERYNKKGVLIDAKFYSRKLNVS